MAAKEAKEQKDKEDKLKADAARELFFQQRAQAKAEEKARMKAEYNEEVRSNSVCPFALFPPRGANASVLSLCISSSSSSRMSASHTHLFSARTARCYNDRASPHLAAGASSGVCVA